MPAAMFRTDFTRQSHGAAAMARRSMRLIANPHMSDAPDALVRDRPGPGGQFSFGFAEAMSLSRPRGNRPRPTLVVTDRPQRQPERAVETQASRAKPMPRALGEIPLQSRADGLDSRFTAWRGKSGRRYVATAYPLASDEALSFEDAVLIAIAADRSVLAVQESGPFEQLDALQGWRAEMAAAGVVEIHVHLIAATPEERQRALADLDPGTVQAH